ncbi:MAG: hypothetical protein KBG28_08800 [Kofleriaceae bacterium]|nr:hypothetical protein [Kofleriaceae bacterium]MBP6839177.1 hypothetical protein [Kofleriaceae bacterium]MBP9204046.1 hypothetical protein [Kofleriaceae bacterium]
MAPRHLPARRLVAAALALIALASTVAPTQAEPTGGADDAQAQAWIDQARVAAEHKDFAAALRLLGQAHARSADARLLFAMGQMAFNLGAYDDAVSYYQRFLATGPDDDAAALARQAVVAARAARDAARPGQAPPPAQPALVPRRVPTGDGWDWVSSVTLAGGGVATAGGIWLLVSARQLAQRDDGTATEFEQAYARAQTRRWLAVGAMATGAGLVTAALVRWRLRAGRTEVIMTAGDGGGAISWSGRW